MTTPTDEEIIAWLHSPRPQDKAALERFLDAAPVMVANDTLHRIASQAVPSRGTLATHFMAWCQPFLWAGFVYLITEDLRQGKSLMVTILWSIMPLALFGMNFHTLVTNRKRKRGEEAVLLIAARNDSRALPLLITEWRRNTSEKARAWNDRVEAEATRLLDENQGGTTSVEWTTLRKVVTGLMLPHHPRVKDITPGQAYFAAAILRILNRVGGTENLALLKSVACLPADASRHPNRSLVIEVATVYQGAANAPALPTTAPMTATTPTVSQVQTLRRP